MINIRRRFMGLSTVDSANEQMAAEILETSLPPIHIQQSETSSGSLSSPCEGKQNSIGDLAKKLLVDISTDQPFSLGGVAADIGSHTFDLLSPSKKEGDSTTVSETAQKTAKHAAVAGLITLSSIPIQQAMPVLNTLPIQTVADVCQVAFLTLNADKNERVMVALKETSGLVLTCAAVALATSCAHVVLPAAIIQGVAMTIFINFTAGMAVRGALKTAENMIAPAA
jgi:hypothetical protein